jgi:ABC-2 type transport system ATP-binding protein
LTRFSDKFCAVNGIDLKVECGLSYGFLGPNGAGKSTTIKMLTGLLAPTSGQISMLGRNMSVPSEGMEAKGRVGVVPEDLALFDNLTGPKYLTFVGRMYGIPAATVRSRSGDLLRLLCLEGEEKKLALAATLLPNPDLLFLDESFEGVDAVTSRVIRDLQAWCVSRGRNPPNSVRGVSIRHKRSPNGRLPGGAHCG